MGDPANPVFALYNLALTDDERRGKLVPDRHPDKWKYKDEDLELEPGESYSCEINDAVLAANAQRDQHLQAIQAKVAAIPKNQPGASGWHLSDTKGEHDPIGRYRLERIDTKHRMGDYLLGAYKEFMGETLKNMNFWKWLEQHSQNDDKVKEWNPALLKSDVAKRHPEWVALYIQWFRKGVKYVNDENARDRYWVEIKGGQLLRKQTSRDQNRTPFDTKELVQHLKAKPKYASLTGITAIWVFSPANKFYSHLVKLGRFHHSSLLEGTEINAAGEWGVKQGKIEWINGKSGHYRPDTALFIGAVKFLKQENAFDADAVVKLYNKAGLEDPAPVDKFLDNVDRDINYYKSKGLEVFA